MDVYSERLTRLVGHIPPEMLPSLPDVVVECIHLHAAQPGAALRNRSEAAFLRWLCSQIESSVAKKARSKEGKGPERKPHRPQETPLERKGVHRTRRQEQETITPLHVRHGHKETKELMKGIVGKTNRNNTKTLASHYHQSLEETGHLTGLDNHRVRDSLMETKEQKGRNERNGNNRMHFSLNETNEARKVEDTSGKNRKPLVSPLYDSLSETEDFMEIEKTSGNQQNTPESFMYDGQKETTDFTEGQNTHGHDRNALTYHVQDSFMETTELTGEGEANGNKQKQLSFHTYDNLEKTREPKPLENNHLASHTGDNIDETKEPTRVKNMNDNNRCAAQMGDNLEETKEPIRVKNTDAKNHFVSHMCDNLEEIRELLRVKNTNESNRLASHMGDNLDETKEHKRVKNTNGRNHFASRTHDNLEEIRELLRVETNENNHLASFMGDNLEETKELIVKNKDANHYFASHMRDNLEEIRELLRVEDANENEGDRDKDTTDLKTVKNINTNNRKNQATHTRDIFWETKEFLRETKEVKRRNGNNYTNTSLKDTKEFVGGNKSSGNHRNHLASHTHDDSRETKDLRRERKGVDKRNIHSSFKETKDLIRGDESHRNHRKPVLSYTCDNLKETKDLIKVHQTHGNHRRPVPSYMRDYLKETKDPVRVDKACENRQKPAQSYMIDILKEPKDIRVTQTNGNNRKPIPSHRNLRETEEPFKTVTMVGSREGDDHREAKKQRRGPGRPEPSARTHHSREKTAKRKHRKSPETVSSAGLPSCPHKSVFTYLSLVETVDNELQNPSYDWMPTGSISRRNATEAKEPSRSKTSKKTTKDWKTVGSYASLNLKTESNLTRLGRDRKPPNSSCADKDKTRTGWKPGRSYRETESAAKRVQFLLESVG